MSSEFEHVASNLRREIEGNLIEIGLLCRVFSRGKSSLSLTEKIKSSPAKYAVGKKLIQDAVGIRVISYFQEDIQIVEKILRRKYTCDDLSSTIDKPTGSEFSASRYNLIFRLPEQYFRDIREPTDALPVDRAFEVQIRTILSEGWHEVDHDLRYKRKSDWEGHDDLARSLNGVVATLETAEWSMRKIFDDLAYKHYKNKKWDAMLYSTLRMRITAPLSQTICQILESDSDAARKILRINRSEIFHDLARLVPKLPLTSDNIVYVWNHFHMQNDLINDRMPQIIRETFEKSNNNSA